MEDRTAGVEKARASHPLGSPVHSLTCPHTPSHTLTHLSPSPSPHSNPNPNPSPTFQPSPLTLTLSQDLKAAQKAKKVQADNAYLSPELAEQAAHAAVGVVVRVEDERAPD